MPEKVRPREAAQEEDDAEYIEVKVMVHDSPITVRIKKGTKRSEVLKIVKEEAKKLGVVIGDLKEWSISFHGEHISIDPETGTISEDQDSIIENTTSLILTQRVIGGILYPVRSLRQKKTGFFSAEVPS